MKTSTRLVFSVPVGETELVVSPDAGVRIETHNLAVALDLPEGYLKTDDTYKSPNYDTATIRVELVLEQVLGKFTLRVEK
jgi:hypothetical protein